MSDDETIKNFCERIDSFSSGFAAITKNINEQLEKMSDSAAKLAENTSFLPKILASNKEIKKSTEKLNLIITTLLARLEKLGGT
jgi:regulator of sigma D